MTDAPQQPCFDHFKDKGQLNKHLACVNFQLDVARDNFFNYTRGFKYTGKLGEYVIRAYCCDEMNRVSMVFGWPCAFVSRQSQTVNAAVWLKNNETNTNTLVAIWTFNCTSDKTNVFLLDGFSEDVLTACGYGEDDVNREVITSRDCDEAFNIGGGDYVVEAFHCPVLENISFEAMEQFDTRTPNTILTSEVVCAAHGPAYSCYTCRD